MQQRANKKKMNADGIGPGKLSAMLSITTADNKKSLITSDIIINDYGIKIPDNEIIITTRIGVKYAGNDALLPYRFWIDKEKIKNYIK